MELGTMIKKATTAMGVKPCRGCQSRAQALNYWSRRGFIGVIAWTVSALMTPKMLRAVTGIEETLPSQALQLVRTLNTIQAQHFAAHGQYATKAEMLRELEEGLKQSGGGWDADLAQRVDVESEELLKGWLLDFHSHATGYLFTLSQKVNDQDRFAPRSVLITDEGGEILEATVSEPMQTKASKLRHAREFPGARPYDTERKRIAGWRGMLMPRPGDCLGCCYADQCCGTSQECGGRTAINCGVGGCNWCTGCSAWCSKSQRPPAQCQGGNN